jgi:hypothetical protein
MGSQTLNSSTYCQNQIFPMKIVHFSWEFPPTIWGGLGTFTTELSQQQVSLGNQVTVFALNSGNNFSPSQNWNGVEVYRPKTLDLSSSFRLFANQDVHSWGSHFNFFADVFNYNISSAEQLVNTLVRTNRRSSSVG